MLKSERKSNYTTRPLGAAHLRRGVQPDRRRHQRCACQRRSGRHSTVSKLPRGWLSAPQAARFLGRSIRSLEAMRRKGRGPTFVQMGGRPAYAETELRRWLPGGAE